MRFPSIGIIAFVLLQPALFGDAKAIGKFPCDAYTKAALAAAEVVRTLNCGFDLNHPQWSTERSVHAGWCLASNQDSVDHESKERSSQVSLCAMCRGYANVATDQAKKVHQTEECRTYVGGLARLAVDPRYSLDPEKHFQWCMGLKKSSRYTATDQERKSRTFTIENCTVFRTRQQNVTVPEEPRRAATKPTDDARARKSSSATDSVNSGARTIGPCKPGQADDPCKPRTKVLGPGILESDPGFRSQNPATTGSPIAPGGSAPQGSSGVDTLRLR